ncbi:hypothetical protein FOCC_FOCC015015 [Frankliniella occidentalis]|nr:hypothetical protein FOCC_FOCC015015 [Frankliniella occidentalis]
MCKVHENNKSATPCSGEEPSMSTVITAKRKSESRTITRLEGADGTAHTTQQAISNNIVQHFTLLLGTPADAAVVQEVFSDFEAVSGLAVSHAKTNAIALGPWRPADHPLPFTYVESCRILGVIFARTIPDMMRLTWTNVVGAAHGVVQTNWGRSLNLVQKVWFCSTYVLSKLWYTAQVLPAPKDSVERLQSLVARWLWAGSFFRVPFRLVCAPRSAGGLGMLHPYWKAQSLFIGRWLAALVLDQDSFTSAILEVLADKWPLSGGAAPRQIPDSVLHYREYYRCRKDKVLSIPLDGNARAVHRAVYVQLLAEDAPDPPRAERLADRPVQWPTAWQAISRSWHGSATRSCWYRAVHDVEATASRLHAIGQATSPACGVCGREDTLLHRLTECGASSAIWGWLRRALGPLRPDVLIRPDIQWRPKEKNAAHLWVLGKTVRYALEQKAQLAFVPLYQVHQQQHAGQQALIMPQYQAQQQQTGQQSFMPLHQLHQQQHAGQQALIVPHYQAQQQQTGQQSFMPLHQLTQQQHAGQQALIMPHYQAQQQTDRPAVLHATTSIASTPSGPK